MPKVFRFDVGKAGEKTDAYWAESNYHARVAALLNELLEVLTDFHALLANVNNGKEVAQPTIGGAEYKAGWSDGWDACATEVMRIVQTSEFNIKTIEGK